MTDVTPIVPSPAAAITAEPLIERIGAEGGRAFRTGKTFRADSERAFVLTTDPDLAEWLLRLGGKPHSFGDREIRPLGGYWRAQGVKEWDIWIDTIPVSGKSVTEALAA